MKKDIKGYEGLYSINDQGEVYSYITGKILTPHTCSSGYLKVILCKNKVHKNRMIHRLVAEAFIPNHDGKPTVNHIDGNKQNNCVSNLEWNTYSENLKHAYSYGLNCWNKKKGRPMRPVHMIDKKSGEILKTYGSISEAVKEVGGERQSQIVDVCRGRRKYFKGYVWRYADDNKV